MSDPSTPEQGPYAAGQPTDPQPPGYTAPAPQPVYGAPAPQPDYAAPPPQPYGAPPPAGYGGPPAAYYGQLAPFPKNSLGGWALALGIAAFGLFLGFIAGVPAIIVGNQAKRAVARGEANNASMATAGIVLGWIATVLSVVVFLALIALIAWGRNSDMHFTFNGRSY